MAITGSRQFLTQWSGDGSPDDPNLVSADEIAAYAVPSTSASAAVSIVTSQVASGGLGSVPISTADSKAVSSGLQGSVADSKALSGSINTSVADSKATSVGAVTGAPNTTTAAAYVRDPLETGVVSLIYPIGDLRRYGWVGGADESASFHHALASVIATGLNVITIPEGTTNLDNVSHSTAYTVALRGCGRGISILRHKNSATATMFTLGDGASLFARDLTFDGNHTNHTQAMMLSLTPGSGNVDFVNCEFKGWRQYGIKLNKVNGTINFADCVWGDAKCGGATAALTSYAIHLGSTYVSNGRLSMLRPVGKQTTAPGLNEYKPSFLTLGADEAGTFSVDITQPDLDGYGANPPDGASGVIDMYQFVHAFRLLGGSIKNSGVCAIKLGNCPDFDVSGVVIDGDATGNDAAAIFHSGYARFPSTVYENGRIHAIVKNWTRGYAVHLAGAGAVDNHSPRRYDVHVIATACKGGVFLDGVGDVEITPSLYGCTGTDSDNTGINIRRCWGTIKISGGFIRGGATFGILSYTGAANASIVIKGMTFDTNTTHHIRLYDQDPGTIPLIRISDCEFLGITPTALVQGVTRLDWRDNYAAQGAPSTASITTESSSGNSWD